MAKLDSTDIRILEVLQENSHLTTKELAAKVNLSPSPAFERQKRLERDGYIDHYMAVVDPEKVGNGLLVLCGITLRQHSKRLGAEFVEAVNHIPEIVECWNTSGDYDFIMKIYVSDMKRYQDFVLNTLGVVESIGSLHSFFVIGTVKNGTVPIPKAE
ncbi:MAG: Lrp/AsnC family transcriptional regulator [Salinivirgaceae bacterium]|nr:Lrp/AsnC family transcriptional regulator [Salinivirgaceae bacterium]